MFHRTRIGSLSLGHRRAAQVAVASIVLVGASPALARCAGPWDHLLESGREFIEPLPLSLTAGAAMTPAVFATSGLDHELRLSAQTSLRGRYNIEPFSPWVPHALLGGVALGYGLSVALDSCGAQEVQGAMLQAAVVTLTVVGAAKWASGRSWPNRGLDPEAQDRLQHPEHATSFSPFENGLAAFPSGHTAVTFAMAAALRSSGDRASAYRFLGYPVAIAVGFAMWWGDHHWASDVLSGALLGEAIGGSVGRAFTQESETWTVHLVPASRSGVLVLWSGNW